MNAIRRFVTHVVSIPPITPWYFSEPSKFRGKHELHTRPSPQQPNVLREHAPRESIVSSNRMRCRQPRTESRENLS